MNKKRLTIPGALMLVFLAVITTFNITIYVVSDYYDKRLGNIQHNENEYEKFSEVSAIVEKYFVGDYTEKDLMDGAIRGYISGLGDKWSGYYTAEEYKLISDESNNKYAGIGITISYDDATQYYMISDLEEDGTASKAGIGIGDMITAVEDKDVRGVSQNEVVEMVRGDEGTFVKITVLKKDGSLQDYTLERQEIYTPDITSRMLENDIGFIRIDAFDNGAEKEFNTHLDELIDKGAKALIFDVRVNGGGYANVMSKMLDRLLPQGMIISMTSKDGMTQENVSDEDWVELPMAVLTNKYSISAAEFFAAAIQEYGVGTIVGDATGGKGYAQTTMPLSDGSALNISTYRYYTPKGNSLTDVGVTPDIEVSLSPEALYNFYSLTDEEDTQLQKAIEVLMPKVQAAIEAEQATEATEATTND
ncbi:MAG: S41 family peptidase [Clostridia bacterium]|nr:S41 family peptidase [Clostridia bacterium]